MGQSKFGSRSQLPLQPSPGLPLPSSHCSMSSRMPLPQRGPVSMHPAGPHAASVSSTGTIASGMTMMPEPPLPPALASGIVLPESGSGETGNSGLELPHATMASRYANSAKPSRLFMFDA
jgi:hypothetical protein